MMLWFPVQWGSILLNLSLCKCMSGSPASYSVIYATIYSLVLAFIVAGVLWLFPFVAEMPMPYSVPGSRSEIHRTIGEKICT